MFFTMKLCLKMSRPDAQDLNNMKRVGRFGCLFEWQARSSALHALADADWAGDRQSRKSVSGGMILHEKRLIKAWTKQQSIVATSTAEAELYAGNRAATESMGVQAFAKDLGRVVPIQLHIDSSAAPFIISRKGLGKAKHIEIQYLWVQEAVRKNKLMVEKIPSETNSSDLGTKHLTSERSEMMMKLVNCSYVWGLGYVCSWPTSCALVEVEEEWQESTRLPTCVVLKIAPGGAVNTLCVCRDSTWPWMWMKSEEWTCCVREPVGECHPLAMIAYSENRPRWHNERRQAKVNMRPRSSPRPRTSHVVVHSSSGKYQASHGKREYPKRRRHHCGLSVSVPL